MTGYVAKEEKKALFPGRAAHRRFPLVDPKQPFAFNAIGSKIVALFPHRSEKIPTLSTKRDRRCVGNTGIRIGTESAFSYSLGVRCRGRLLALLVGGRG